jgi:hypothetical protein
MASIGVNWHEPADFPGREYPVIRRAKAIVVQQV